MNRRQFLGRFFQAVISKHNSNSIYGIYHPWRQYNNISQNAVIYLRCKSGADVTFLPSVSQRDTIIAVYNANNEMIYCSAYKRNGTIYNNLNDTIYLNNIAPGTYKIKCLQYGIGLDKYNNNQVAFVVPDLPDRTGLPNNNYGYINNPQVEIQYLFALCGLCIEVEPVLASIGDIQIDTDLFENYKIKCTAPDFLTYKSLVEAAASSIGLTVEVDEKFGYRQFICDNLPVPLTNQYCSKTDDIYYMYPILHIYNIDSNGRTDINSVPLNGYYDDFSEYWNICAANNLEYDPELYSVNHDPFNDGYWHGCDSLTDTSTGSYETIIYRQIPGIINIPPDVHATQNFMYYGARVRNDAYSSFRMEECVVSASSRSIEEKILKAPKLDPEDPDNYQSYSGTTQLMLNITMSFSGYTCIPEYEVHGSRPGNFDKLSDQIAWMLAQAKELFEHDAWVHYQNTELTKVNQSWLKFEYPIEALFGHIPPDKTMGLHRPRPTEEDFEAVAFANEKTGTVSVYWGVDTWLARELTREMRPCMEGYTLDLSSYDPNNKCNDRSMWKMFDNYWVFLRQNIIEVDTESIPDHPITY